jgi:hypothetical protein
MDDLKIILEKYQNGSISSKIVFKKIVKNKIHEDELKQIMEYIYQELDIHMNNKKYFNLLKSILITLNKKNNTVKSKKKYEEELNQLLQKYVFIDYKNTTPIHETSSIIEKDVIELQNQEYEETNQETIIQNHLLLNQFFSKYRNYYIINFQLLNQILENVLIHSSQPISQILSSSITSSDFLSIMKENQSKIEKHNNMCKIIQAFDNQQSLIYLGPSHVLEEPTTVLHFAQQCDYHYVEKDKLNKNKLKRGFIHVVEKDTQKYIIKYQPNKSFIEIIMNIFLQNLPNAKKYICFPEQIVMNHNNSYFYIIQKYDCDLFKFFQHKIWLNEKQIQKIFYFMCKSIHFLHKHNIIYADLKLENIVVQLKENKIHQLKLIDFDVSLFNQLPQCLESFDQEIKNIFENKKCRGTKIYMKKTKTMDFNNDIYSIGVALIVLLYKNVLVILEKEKSNVEENVFEKIKAKLGKFKNKLEQENTKFELLNYIVRIYKNRRFSIYWKEENINLSILRKLIHQCLNNEINIQDLEAQVKLLENEKDHENNHNKNDEYEKEHEKEHENLT